MSSVWYLSFVSNDGWRGGCFVLTEGEDPIEAVREAHRQGCNPGGEVAIMGPAPLDMVPIGKMNRLLTREEVESVR